MAASPHTICLSARTVALSDGHLEFVYLCIYLCSIVNVILAILKTTKGIAYTSKKIEKTSANEKGCLYCVAN